MKNFLKKYQNQILLFLILAIALFFRTYQIVDRFEFAHDSDLYSWIVKDVVVNHHLRLIGQLTSADGIFIGPFFYYMLVPFFMIFKMDPVGALVPITILGLATVFSYYWVFSRLFKREVGLIIAFLQSVLIIPVYFDRAVIPTTPTSIWMIWYFYAVISLVRGNYKAWPLLGLLSGLVWEIHIALAPAFLALPVALILSKKWPSIKQLVLAAGVFLVTSTPLILFELKHHFSQTLSFMHDFSSNHGGGAGMDKMYQLFTKLGSNIDRLFFYPQTLPFNHFLTAVFIFLSALILIKKKLLSFKELIVLFSWIFGVIVFFTISSSLVSEYYLANVEVIFMAIVALWIFWAWQLSKTASKVVLVLLVLLLVKNIYFFVTDDIYKKGYNERKAVADYIAKDSRSKGFPCVAVSYITKPGENVGYRYFFWLDNLHVNQSKSGSPDYTIVFPIEMAPENQTFRIEHMGVIPPQTIPDKKTLDYTCSGANSNLTDPMFGYTE